MKSKIRSKVKITNTIDDYYKLHDDIFEYFGYVENWRILPIVDMREHYWKIDENSDVCYSDTKDFDAEETRCFELYEVHVNAKSIYRGEDFTMLSVGVSGNEFLSIFSNNKEVQ